MGLFGGTYSANAGENVASAYLPLKGAWPLSSLIYSSYTKVGLRLIPGINSGDVVHMGTFACPYPLMLRMFAAFCVANGGNGLCESDLNNQASMGLFTDMSSQRVFRR